MDRGDLIGLRGWSMLLLAPVAAVAAARYSAN